MRIGLPLRPPPALVRPTPTLVHRSHLCSSTTSSMPPRQQPTLGSFFGQQGTRKLAGSPAPGEQAPLSTFFDGNKAKASKASEPEEAEPTQASPASGNACPKKRSRSKSFSRSTSAEPESKAGRKRSASASNEDDAPPKSRARQGSDSDATTPDRVSTPPTKETASVYVSVPLLIDRARGTDKWMVGKQGKLLTQEPRSQGR